MKYGARFNGKFWYGWVMFDGQRNYVKYARGSVGLAIWSAMEVGHILATEALENSHTTEEQRKELEGLLI